LRSPRHSKDGGAHESQDKGQYWPMTARSDTRAAESRSYFNGNSDRAERGKGVETWPDRHDTV